MSPEAALAFLQLRPGASKSEIKQAYRRLAKQCHPDMFLDPRQKLQAEGEFKRLQAAVDALSAGYSTPTDSSAAPAHSGAPFDPRDIYGSTYAYSFARRRPLERSPLLGCILAFALPGGAAIAFQANGLPGLGWFLLVATVLGATVWLIRYTIAAIRTHGSLTKALWQLNSWENRSALYGKWWDRFWLLPIVILLFGPAIVAASAGPLMGLLAFFALGGAMILSSYLLRLLAGAIERRRARKRRR